MAEMNCAGVIFISQQLYVLVQHGDVCFQNGSQVFRNPLVATSKRDNHQRVFLGAGWWNRSEHECSVSPRALLVGGKVSEHMAEVT